MKLKEKKKAGLTLNFSAVISVGGHTRKIMRGLLGENSHGKKGGPTRWGKRERRKRKFSIG